MKLELFQVDAFTDKLYSGNPAAVIPLEKWLPDNLMQTIAMENNLSETVFYVPKGNDFHIRWFTPMIEVNLCGHATLAAAHVMYHHNDYEKPQINFHSLSGLLTVKRSGEMITLNFPTDEPFKIEIPNVIVEAIGMRPVEVYKGRNVLLAVLNSQKEIETLNPEINLVAQAHPHGIIFTANGEDVDFVSRCFFPNTGVNEDPVTGSAHTILTPYWAAKLNKSKLTAKQLSKRVGDLICELKGNRVEISGKAITYMTSEIEVN